MCDSNLATPEATPKPERCYFDEEAEYAFLSTIDFFYQRDKRYWALKEAWISGAEYWVKRYADMVAPAKVDPDYKGLIQILESQLRECREYNLALNNEVSRLTSKQTKTIQILKGVN